MAKSKSGGTRSFIRGKIGSDVYSVGKDGKGKKQQNIRSLAEVVANPQTQAQMRGRMIMYTVSQAVSALKPIINHSFDNVPVGQPSISEFVRRNYALIKADVAANPSTGNSFGLAKYQVKGACAGAYIVSAGSVLVPEAVELKESASVPEVSISLTAGSVTVGGLRAALSLTSEEYFTIVNLDDYSGGWYARLRVNSSLADDVVISDDNVASIFTVEGNMKVIFGLTGNKIIITSAEVHNQGASGVIVSKVVDGKWSHSTCVLVNNAANPSFAADAALPTYPIGEQLFLNGGEL